MSEAVACRVCGAEASECQRATVLDRYAIRFYRCSQCEYLQTETPFWLDEAYSESINITDTGLVARNLELAKASTVLLGLFFDRHGKFLDFAGGYGLFVRLMRDVGFDFYWTDKYSTNLLAQGFEGDVKSGVYEAVTAFEVFEHFVDPVGELRAIGNLADTVVFSTELYGRDVPDTAHWYYYGLDHGQHIGFFNLHTLRFIARLEGYNLWSDGRSFHVFSRRPCATGLMTAAMKAKRLGLASMVGRMLKSRTVVDGIDIR